MVEGDTNVRIGTNLLIIQWLFESEANITTMDPGGMKWMPGRIRVLITYYE